MEMTEPKIEFISFDQEDIIITSGGSIETCNGTNAPMNTCSTEGAFMV